MKSINNYTRRSKLQKNENRYLFYMLDNNIYF